MMNSPAPLPGERKPVAILFTDIVGSTALAEQLDPEEWREIVSGAHRLVGEAVRHYEGTVAQLLGDGVLAFFGAPQTHEDDPQRAVFAALEIQRALQDYRRQLAGMLEDFQMRIGIHSGTVVVGPLGDGQRVEYLAVGDAVNLAARLQSAASPGGVLVSQAVARLVKGVVQLEDRGEIAVKGKSAPVHVYAALGLQPEPKPGRGIAWFSSPLVGRQAELASVLEALSRLEQGGGWIVGIYGEAGIGKSRLVQEARRFSAENASQAGFRWLEGRALSYGQSLSFWTITQLIREDLGLSDGDVEIRVKAALRRRMRGLFGERQDEFLPYLAHMLGVRSEPEWAEKLRLLEGETLKRQVLLSIGAYFRQVAGERPLVLVFEDLHWTDPSSLEALENLLPLTDKVPLLLLLLGRPEREHGSWRIRMTAQKDYAYRYTELNVRPLTPDQENQLVDNLLRAAELRADLRQRLLERSEGNPFYLEEVIQSLIEQGSLVQQDGSWRAGEAIDRLEIPDTLQGVLLARIDRLQEDVRQTLQMASVIGRSFLYSLLQAVSEAEAQLDQHLAQLQRIDLVREKTRRPELEYIFKHSLTQEAAYNSLLLERRKEFHRRTAEALESLFAGRIDEVYGFLAHHYESAGEIQKAVAYLIKAGDKARLENAFEEAREMYRHAVDLMGALGDRERQANTWLKLGLVYQAEFAFGDAQQAYEKAFTLQRQTRLAPGKHPVDVSTGARRRVLRVSRYSVSPISDLMPSQKMLSPDIEIFTSLFAGLVEYDLETNIVPHAARSWEVLEGGRRYLFHLRDDAFWTDGTPLRAADFEWAWKRVLTPGVANYPANLLDVVLGARRYRLGETQDPESVVVRALDPLTLEVRLENPTPYFTYLAAFPITFPQPRRTVERYGDEWWRPPHGVFNGPFRLVEFSPSRLRMERNPVYFGNFSGNLDEIVVDFARIEDSAPARRFLENELDLLMPFSQSESPVVVPAAFQHARRGLISSVLLFNPTKPPLADRRVRQAMASGVDFNRWSERTFGGKAHREGGLVPPGMAGYSPELGLPFDLPLARRLLAEAGYPGGRGLPALKFGFFVELNYLEELCSELEANLGIRCDVLIAPFNSEEIALKNVDFTIMLWSADYPDPDNFLRGSISASGGLKDTGWRHARFDQLIEEAGKSMDQKLRLELYREADRILLNEEVVMVSINHGIRRGLDLIQPWVSGCESDALGYLHFKTIRLEREG